MHTIATRFGCLPNPGPPCADEAWSHDDRAGREGPGFGIAPSLVAVGDRGGFPATSEGAPPHLRHSRPITVGPRRGGGRARAQDWGVPPKRAYSVRKPGWRPAGAWGWGYWGAGGTGHVSGVPGSTVTRSPWVTISSASPSSSS